VRVPPSRVPSKQQTSSGGLHVAVPQVTPRRSLLPPSALPASSESLALEPPIVPALLPLAEPVVTPLAEPEPLALVVPIPAPLATPEDARLLVPDGPTGIVPEPLPPPVLVPVARPPQAAIITVAKRADRRARERIIMVPLRSEAPPRHREACSFDGSPGSASMLSASMLKFLHEREREVEVPAEIAFGLCLRPGIDTIAERCHRRAYDHLGPQLTGHGLG
jgi:hypothetical protein